MKNGTAVIFIIIAALLFPSLNGAEIAGDATPRVVATSPMNGAVGVDPSLTRITVTFNKQMMDKSWSWSYENRESFPQTAGQPSYTDDGMTCVLPVKLEPGKRYVIWINTPRYKNFKDRHGNAVDSYKLVFTTRQK
ncbi:MAG TPA: Ig-like domain-containing protein [Dissulfurispiraceae bacterium]|nr:Ig-like domain-containing protein [Dissulfurispiraceae bacterium]